MAVVKCYLMTAILFWYVRARGWREVFGNKVKKVCLKIFFSFYAKSQTRGVSAFNFASVMIVFKRYGQCYYRQDT